MQVDERERVAMLEAVARAAAGHTLEHWDEADPNLVDLLHALGFLTTEMIEARKLAAAQDRSDAWPTAPAAAEAR